MRHQRSILFCLLVFGLASCETDLKEVDRLASIQAEEPVDISTGVTIIFSDSAMVKAKIVAPEMRNFFTADSTLGNVQHHEFPKGITIHFYGPHGEETQVITSDYAIRREGEEVVEFRNNVVITRADGLVIKTEELIHDEKANIFYNNSPISGYSRDGENTFQGASFHSDGDFRNIDIQNTTGVILLDRDRFPGR